MTSLFFGVGCFVHVQKQIIAICLVCFLTAYESLIDWKMPERAYIFVSLISEWYIEELPGMLFKILNCKIEPYDFPISSVDIKAINL